MNEMRLSRGTNDRYRLAALDEAFEDGVLEIVVLGSSEYRKLARDAQRLDHLRTHGYLGISECRGGFLPESLRSLEALRQRIDIEIEVEGP